MTEPQVWTLIGVFAAALIGLLTIMSTTFVRVLRAETGGVNARIAGVDTRIDSLRAEVIARMAGVDTRIDSLHPEMTARSKESTGASTTWTETSRCSSATPSRSPDPAEAVHSTRALSSGSIAPGSL